MLIVLFLAATGCAGRRPSGQAPEKPGPERPYPSRPGALPHVPGMVEPILRIGLKTDATSATLESGKGLNVSDGSRTFSGGSRVVASPAFVANVAMGYTVQVNSFSSKENAEQARAALSGRTSRRVFVYHNPDRDMEQVRIGPFSTKEEAQKVVEEMKGLGFTGAFYVSDDAGMAGSRAELIVRDDTGSVLVKTHRPVQIWSPDLTLLIDRDFYRGYVIVFVNDVGRLTVVNAANFEDYLKGVVPNEIGGGSADTFDALKAQAVAARTYAYKNRGQFEKDGFDICASSRCQVYSGMKNEANYTSSAVDATKGEVLTYAGDPINALYTSTCGGRTENAEYMFDNMNFPYLKSVECYPEEAATKQASAKLEGTVQPWWLAWMNAKMMSSVGGDMSQPLQLVEASSAISNLLQYLGKTSCSTQSLQGTTWIATGNQLVSELCWQVKRDSLLTEKDYQYFLSHLSFSLDPTPETHSFLFLFHENILVPDASTMNRFNPYLPMKRVDFYRALFQILDHYRQINPAKGQAREVRRGQIQVVDDQGVHLYELANPVYLFQLLNESRIPREDLACSPGDNVEYLVEEGRIRILACEISQAGAAMDRSSKYSFWQESVSPSDLGQRIAKYADVGDVVDLQPLSYGVSGRIYEMKITGTKNTAVLSGIRVRWALGLKDNLFTVERTYTTNGKVREFVFTGRGWGHGVGMCQVGALGYARQGMDYRKILQHYYTGVQINKLW